MSEPLWRANVGVSCVDSGENETRFHVTHRRFIERGERVTAPGIPPDFPDPKSLVTNDCIRPAL